VLGTNYDQCQMSELREYFVREKIAVVIGLINIGNLIVIGQVFACKPMADRECYMVIR
jgi:hypothetical protein